MQGIDKIYSNEIGISFYWKADSLKTNKKIQLIFRDIGFLLTLKELKTFAEACQSAYASSKCSDCKLNQDCRNLLLKTPSDKIDLAVSQNELALLALLFDTTILRAELHLWIQNSLN